MLGFLKDQSILRGAYFHDASKKAQAAAPRQKTKIDAKKARQAARERFKRAHLAEKAFARKLKKVAKEVGKIVNRLAPRGKVKDFPALKKALDRYSRMIGPWAALTAKSMIAEVAQRDSYAWAEMGREMGRSLRSEILIAPIQPALDKMLLEQVALIKSLPTQEATRVHHLMIEGMVGGRRAAETAKDIMRSGKVTEARALLIARTETTRTATTVVEARSTYVGSEGYFWRTADDSDVRQEHKKLNGKFIPWNLPPIAGPNGQRYHAGAGPNCRCYPEPVIPDVVA